jgi:hypothetical protein
MRRYASNFKLSRDCAAMTQKGMDNIWGSKIMHQPNHEIYFKFGFKIHIVTVIKIKTFLYVDESQVNFVINSCRSFRQNLL